jgi:hypothetical protein
MELSVIRAEPRCSLLSGSHGGNLIMRGRKILLIAFLAAAVTLPNAAQAQFSLRGIIGRVTHPLREMFGHSGHFPHPRHSRAAEETRLSNPSAQLGNVGPAGWPSAYADVLGFTFWPSRYAEQVRVHGFDVITAALIGQTRGRQLARNATTGAAVYDSDYAPTDACVHAADRVDWPASQIERTLMLTVPQREALGKLRSAVDDAIEKIQANCSDLRWLAPPDRIRVTVQKLWAVRDAAIDVRAQLKGFYDSLTAAQKMSFAWKPVEEHHPQPGGKPVNDIVARRYQACAMPSLQGSQRLMDQIEQEVQPTKEQNAAVQALRKTADDMAKLLTTPCGEAIAADPLARLDAATDQLSSMCYAATSMEIALNSFYARLDGAQRTKFNSLGR